MSLRLCASTKFVKVNRRAVPALLVGSFDALEDDSLSSLFTSRCALLLASLAACRTVGGASDGASSVTCRADCRVDEEDGCRLVVGGRVEEDVLAVVPVPAGALPGGGSTLRQSRDLS